MSERTGVLARLLRAITGRKKGKKETTFSGPYGRFRVVRSLRGDQVLKVVLAPVREDSNDG